MNIFYTDDDPAICASHHCSVHENKMILEYAQLMCTAHYLCGSWEHPMYMPTHNNHPCALWTRASKDNYVWLYELWCALLDNYRKRTLIPHKAELLREMVSSVPDMPDIGATQRPSCVPDNYKRKDAKEAYKAYLNSKYKEWTSRMRPLQVYWMNKPEWVEV